MLPGASKALSLPLTCNLLPGPPVIGLMQDPREMECLGTSFLEVGSRAEEGIEELDLNGTGPMEAHAVWGADQASDLRDKLMEKD